MVALPQVWLFQIMLTTLAPVADLLLVWQLVGQWIAYKQHGSEFTDTDLKLIGIYYVVFIVVDLLAAMVGFVMERREDWRLLLWLPLQRFGYRQMMYYVVLRSIVDRDARPLCGLGQAGAARHGQDRAGGRAKQRLIIARRGGSLNYRGRPAPMENRKSIFLATYENRAKRGSTRTLRG